MTERTVTAEEMQSMLKQQLSEGLPFFLTVTGSSMEPFLRHERDQVILVSGEQCRPCPGEIILFRRLDGSCVLHRIIKNGTGRFLVNGDAQSWTEWVQEEQILAVAEGMVRKGRYLSCRNLFYRFCVKFWGILRPFRKCIFSAAGKLKKIFRVQKIND